MDLKIDFNQRPFIAIWEVTRACDLACVHCRASAQSWRNPLELSTDEGKRLIDEVATLQVSVFVLTGGDPLKRPDTFDLVEYAASRRLRVSLTPSATPLLTNDAIARLKRSGLARLAISLDGPTAQVHDAFRKVSGSFDSTLRAIRYARRIGLPVQINTTITRHNLPLLDDIIALLETLDIALWSAFFLVPTGRGQGIDLLSAEEFEHVFEKLYQLAQHSSFDIKSTEAQHYRRFLLQRRTEARRAGGDRANMARPFQSMIGVAEDGIGRAPKGINDGKGFVFISHIGDVYPSGFLPISAGSVRKQSLTDIYRQSPLFTSLRDPRNLKGKCGECEFREICGGSRARAFALTGDVFSEEPCCVYQPRQSRRTSRSEVASGGKRAC